MTRIAALAKLAAMLVIRTVTRNATRLGFGLVTGLFGVTRTANKIAVRTGQRKMRLLVMIKFPVPPAARTVAVTA